MLLFTFGLSFSIGPNVPYLQRIFDFTFFCEFISTHRVKGIHGFEVFSKASKPFTQLMYLLFGIFSYVYHYAIDFFDFFPFTWLDIFEIKNPNQQPF
jgi:hypothetical protein